MANSVVSEHPRAVEVMTRHKAALGEWVEGVTGLSRPFRHLERLVVCVEGVTQPLGDSHVGRGRLNRSIAQYGTVCIISTS